MAAPDRNPRRRLLALSSDSRAKTLLVAFVVSAVCAVLVSTATVILRPIQAANRAAEEQAKVEALILGIPGMTSLLQDTGGTLTTVVVDLATGRAARNVTSGNLQAMLADPTNWSAIPQGSDIAGLGHRPDFAQIFLLRDGDEISLVLLPMAGQGYNGRIEAILALSGDMRTIAGVSVTRHSETPGLGGRIDEASWQSSWPGTQAFDEDGTVRFAVARGEASNVYEVDGITGATRTSNAVTRMVRFWLGPDGYGPLIDAINRGEF